MRNAKEEFFECISKHSSPVKCAHIMHEVYWNTSTRREVYLPIGATTDQIRQFTNSLDFEYDNGYGSQELYGNIWFEDGAWADRREYDGSEWWEIQIAPIIPLECSTISVPQIENDDVKRIECQV